MTVSIVQYLMCTLKYAVPGELKLAVIGAVAYNDGFKSTEGDSGIKISRLSTIRY